MKTSAIFFQAALMAVALADLATVQGSIGMVTQALTELDTAVKGLDGSNLNSAPAVLKASQKVQTAIGDATTQIQGSDVLSLNDALQLQSSASTLTGSVQMTVNDLVGKKAVLDQLGITQIAVGTLQQQKVSSAALSNAIVSKVPAVGQTIAMNSVNQINTAIDGGIASLSGPGATGAVASASNSTMNTGKAPTAGSMAKIGAAGRLAPTLGDSKWFALIAAAYMV